MPYLRFVLIYCLLTAPFLLMSQSLKDQLQATLDTIYAAHPAAIGLLVHVEAPDLNVSWSGASGFADKANKKPLVADQPFLIASSIKPYMSAAILRLVEEEQLSLEDTIATLLPTATRAIFTADGYDLSKIQVKHLLSHTSGFSMSKNTVEDYFSFIETNPKYRWTRMAQYQFFVDNEQPKDAPGQVFNYTDINYLLLGEIMEGITGQPFYTALRELLQYNTLGLNTTWFPTLEERPANVKPLGSQYWTKRGWDSAELDISWDLYGGGGIAATSKDMALFFHHFFNGNIVQTDSIRNLIFTEIRTPQTALAPYYLGLGQQDFSGMNSFGHGGFWGTTVQHIPSLNASISVCVLERDQGVLRRNILSEFIATLKVAAVDRFQHNAALTTYLEELQDFSGTILVAKDGEVLHERAYGLANREYEIPNAVDTRYNLASITKLITAVGTLRLQEQGLLDLEKTVGEYLPDYPNAVLRDSATLAHLLTHQSGLPRFYGEIYQESNKLRYESVEDYWDLFAVDDLRFSPGSQYEYTGGGFVVLALIIQELTELDYYDYIQQQVFDPAGMQHALAFPADSVVSKVANGYTCWFGDQSYYSRNDHYISKASPAGGYYATARDLFLFSKSLRDGTLLQPETYQVLTTPQVRGYNTYLGYGIDIDQRYHEQIFGHSGGWIGVRTELMDFAASGYTVVVLSNLDDDGKSGASKVIEDLKKIIAGQF